ncbi:dimethylmenaquinone methyltransferase [Beutenbergia cavernae DSM 12333]|uniref:Putative 4-hydroxy-4-methyl-2-oxoglutarate aldolase n=1 Tax=Beutenbergia cavernae (strain ATCC BAA-8 / DSM 12333 / CCUG 43141 / JCM 11478 / NBRC 16432 / NCIMB 13614 / HKI 0122) TaxID=471853 RepID=C5C3P9_BEUC1|nr:RraA family protein [Beutenbergia cavernae]ACQ81958.1 dimethylmenaquinone methyltransferase [Beutenbergia cavernae DSM 12333]
MTDPRPDVDLTAVRTHLTSALLSDALDAQGLRHQCLGTGLALLDPTRVLAGYAFPVTIQRVYDVPAEPFRGLVAALDAIGRDEVFVTATHRAADIAVWGELLSTVCLARGAAGAITDGLVRDTRAVRELGFPVVSAGTIPYDSMGRHEIVAHGVPCVVDGVRIERGDLIVADSDGVVVVPQAVAAGTVRAALDKRRGENAFRRAVAEGMSATEAFATFGVL